MGQVPLFPAEQHRPMSLLGIDRGLWVLRESLETELGGGETALGGGEAALGGGEMAEDSHGSAAASARNLTSPPAQSRGERAATDSERTVKGQ